MAQRSWTLLTCGAYHARDSTLAVPMSVPAPPDPATFGLTIGQVMVFRDEPRGIPFLTRAIFTVLAIELFLWVGPHIRTSTDLFPVVAFGSVGLGLVSMFLAHYINLPVRRHQDSARRRSEAYSRFQQYEAAVERHSARVADIERWDRDARAEAERRSWLKEETWRRLSGWEFETRLANHFGTFGWTAHATRGSGDEGVDIVLVSSRRRVIVQCKAHAKTVAPAPVRELLGALHHHKADEAWLVCLTGFSPGAQAFAQGKPIRLLTVREILKDPSSVYP